MNTQRDHLTMPINDTMPITDARRGRHGRALAGIGCILLLATACGSDDDADAGGAELPSEACDAYAAIGAAMFGDPSTITDSVDALEAAAPDELTEAFATYSQALRAMFEGDEEAMTSEEFLAADRQIGAAVYDSCEAAATLDVSGIDFAFEGIPDEVDAGRVAIRFTNDTESAEAHEMVLMKRVDGADETVAELMELPEEELFSKVVPTAVTYADHADGVNVALVDLEPGSYIAICMIPTNDDGTPHAAGMVDEFSVS